MREWPSLANGINGPKEDKGGFHDATYEQLDKIFWLLYSSILPEYALEKIEDWINGYDSYFKEGFPTGTDWFINWLEGNYT